MSDRLRYHHKTGKYLNTFTDRGFNEQFTTLIELPSEELPDTQYYAMLDENGDVPAYADDVEGSAWTAVDKKVAVIAYSKTDQSTKEFDDASDVTDDYTTIAPSTIYDVWDEDSGEWVTDTDAEFNGDLDALNKKYDALLNAKALEVARAIAANGKDQDDNVETLQEDYDVLLAEFAAEQEELLLGSL